MWSKLLSMLDSVLLASVLRLKQSNRAVQKQIDECEIANYADDPRTNHDVKDLHAMLTISIQRLERIESKAMGTLLGVALAIAVFGATPGIFGHNGLLVGNHWVEFYGGLGLLLAMAYLLASGYLALSAYEIGRVFRPTLYDQAPLAEPTAEACVVLYCIEQNERAATLRSNKLSASFACLRSGLFIIFVLGAFVLAVAVTN